MSVEINMMDLQSPLLEHTIFLEFAKTQQEKYCDQVHEQGRANLADFSLDVDLDIHFLTWTKIENPVGLNVIVRKICSFLDIPALKKVRYLNNLWRSEGGKELLSRAFVIVPKSYHEQLSVVKKQMKKAFCAFIHNKKGVRKIKNLQIRHNNDIPIFLYFGILDKNVENLRCPPLSIDEAENGEWGIRYRYKGTKQMLRIISDLTSLRSLDLRSPSFNNFSFLFPLNLEPFIALNKIYLVRRLAINVKTLTRSKVNILHQFSQGQGQLTSLWIGRGFKMLRRNNSSLYLQFIKVMNKILVENSGTIKEIWVRGPLALWKVPGLEIPALPQLTKLTAILPPNFGKSPILGKHCNVKFPKLNQVTLCTVSRNTWTFNRSFVHFLEEVPPYFANKLVPGFSEQMRVVRCQDKSSAHKVLVIRPKNEGAVQGDGLELVNNNNNDNSIDIEADIDGDLILHQIEEVELEKCLERVIQEPESESRKRKVQIIITFLILGLGLLFLWYFDGSSTSMSKKSAVEKEYEDKVVRRLKMFKQLREGAKINVTHLLEQTQQRVSRIVLESVQRIQDQLYKTSEEA